MDERTRKEWAKKLGLNDDASEADIEKAKTKSLFETDYKPVKYKKDEGLPPEKSAVKATPAELDEAAKRLKSNAKTPSQVFGDDATLPNMSKDEVASFAGPPSEVQPFTPEQPLDKAVSSAFDANMRNVKPAVKQDTTAIDTKANSLFERAQMMLASGKLGPQEENDFEAELQRIQGEYRGERDNLAKREVLHTLVDAITQFGAGYASQATGHNLTNIKTKEHDFQKDRALLEDERKTDLGDLRARRQEDISKREKAADMGYKQASLEQNATKMEIDRIEGENRTELSRYNSELDGAYKAAYLGVLAGKDAKDAAKEVERDKDQYMKAYGAKAKTYYDKWGKSGNELFKIANKKGEYSGLDEEGQQAAFKTVLQGELGMSDKEAAEASTMKTGGLLGFFQHTDLAGISNAMNAHATRQLEMDQRRASGMVLASNPAGQVGWVPYEKAKEKEQKGYKIVE
jgi:hypothetical protein